MQSKQEEYEDEEIREFALIAGGTKDPKAALAAVRGSREVLPLLRMFVRSLDERPEASDIDAEFVVKFCRWLCKYQGFERVMHS